MGHVAFEAGFVVNEVEQHWAVSQAPQYWQLLQDVADSFQGAVGHVPHQAGRVGDGCRPIFVNRFLLTDTDMQHTDTYSDTDCCAIPIPIF